MKIRYFNLFVGIMITIQVLCGLTPSIGFSIGLGILAFLNLLLGFGVPDMISDYFKNKDKNPF